jgi:hypothetical protein
LGEGDGASAGAGIYDASAGPAARQRPPGAAGGRARVVRPGIGDVPDFPVSLL